MHILLGKTKNHPVAALLQHEDELFAGRFPVQEPFHDLLHAGPYTDSDHLFEKIGGFDESVTFCEDHEYAMRAAKEGSFGILHSTKIPVSIRRMDRDGRLNIAVKYLLAETHLFTLGPIRHDKFNDTFGHKKED